MNTDSVLVNEYHFMLTELLHCDAICFDTVAARCWQCSRGRGVQEALLVWVTSSDTVS
jgi:hypothetical protein